MKNLFKSIKNIFTDSSKTEKPPIIPYSNKAYTVSIENKSDKDIPITLFGANKSAFKTKFGIPNEIDISVGESSYQEMLYETQSQPFTISGIRFSSENADQLEEVLKIEQNYADGFGFFYPLQLLKYFSAFQFQTGFRECLGIDLEVNGGTQISFKVLAKAKINIILFISKRECNNIHTKLPFQNKSWLNWIKRIFNFKNTQQQIVPPKLTYRNIFDSQNNSCYTLIVSNNTDKNIPVKLFDANQINDKPNYCLPDGITVEVAESSYGELLFETQTNPFITSGLRILSKNAKQLDQILEIEKRDANGMCCSYPLQVGNYFSAFQFQDKIREIFPYQITVAGTTNIQFMMLANTKVVVVVFPKLLNDIEKEFINDIKIKHQNLHP